MPISPVLAAGLSGFFFGASLIVAIGAQDRVEPKSFVSGKGGKDDKPSPPDGQMSLL